HRGNVQDRDGIRRLLRDAGRRFPSIAKLFADAAYQGPRVAKVVADKASHYVKVFYNSEKKARVFYKLRGVHFIHNN
ncbi:MAG: hypothetical protein QOJ15_9182, partial [Bradyrhizobium sp.]|nr:hypothetical protein [Bradyrhizobium sp.]